MTRKVLGHEPVKPKEPSGADGTVGECATESPRDHDEDRPLDVVPGAVPSGSALLREQVPVGSAAHERQRGNPPGTVPATKVARSGTHGPASLAGSPARRASAHAGTGNPEPHCRTEESRLGSDARERRSDARIGGSSDDHFVVRTDLQWAKPKGVSGVCRVEKPDERNGLVSGRKP